LSYFPAGCLLNAMVAAALRVGVALACGAVGVRDGVIDVAVLCLGIAGGGGTGLAAGVKQVLQLAAWHIAIFCMPVVAGVPGDGLEGDVQPPEEVQ
jgi:hypothetical protein